MENEVITLKLLPGEKWWGGRTADGIRMPYGNASFNADLFIDLQMNQAAPLLLSNKGRFIWSEEPFAFIFNEQSLTLDSRGGNVVCGEGYSNLHGAYKHVSKRYFPASGSYPDKMLFEAPQYNLWIELLYEPTQKKVLEYARAVLAHGLPPGVIMIDDNWHEPYGTWCFHSGRFPDPKAMMDELHEMGFKVMLWICPFVSPDSLTFRQIEPKGYLLKDSLGKTVIRRWWNGYSALLDCTNERTIAWIHRQLDDLQLIYGVDGFKLDAGDLIYYETSDQSAVPTTPNGHCEAWAKIGLRYRLNEYRACWKLAGQPLAQRLKDKNHLWGDNGLASLIPDGLAQGLLGYAFSCPDMIGGGEYTNFLENSLSLDQELFVRYAQCSVFFPMMQFSAAPWRVLDQEHLQYCQEAVNLRKEMNSTIMRLVELASINGEPIIRHMAYVFPEGSYEEIKDQFMLGDAFLVAPVLEKGARKRRVTFPDGEWVGDDGSIVIGPCEREIKAPLSRLPWYKRKGKIIT